MRPELLAIVERLFRESGGRIDLDAFADAVTELPISAAEVEAVVVAFEERGGVIQAGPSGGGSARLRVVLAVARDLRARLGRRPTLAEIATAAQMPEGLVRAALSLGSVMGR